MGWSDTFRLYGSLLLTFCQSWYLYEVVLVK